MFNIFFISSIKTKKTVFKIYETGTYLLHHDISGKCQPHTFDINGIYIPK